jgi:hypothetical protein
MRFGFWSSPRIVSRGSSVSKTLKRKQTKYSGGGKNNMDVISLIVQIVVAVVVLAPVLWIVGKWFVGKDKAKFTDAVWIGVLGVIIGAGVGWLLPGWGAILGTLIMIVVWLLLIKHFFDCGWLKALAIAIIAGIIYLILSLIISFILVLLGFSALPSLW